MDMENKKEINSLQLKYRIESPYVEDPQLILARLNSTEKHFNSLSHAFKHLVDAKIKLRDRCDGLSVLLNDIGEAEGIGNQISEVAKCLASCQEPLDRVSERLLAAVTRTLQSTVKYCPIARNQVKNVEKMRSQESRAASKVSRQRERGITDYRTLTKKLSISQGASEKSEKAADDLLDSIETFERKRFNDLQQVMRDYILLELNYHSKSIEAFSESYRRINSMQFDPSIVYSIVGETAAEVDSSNSSSEDLKVESKVHQTSDSDSFRNSD